MQGRESWERAALAGVLASIGCAWVVLALLPSYPNDALYMAAIGARSEWSEVVTRVALFPPLVAWWKAAGLVLPADPAIPIRLAVAALHVGAAGLCFALLRPMFGPRVALAACAIFGFYRPGAFTLLWAGAVLYVVQAFFGLLCLLCWERGRGRPAWRWAAVGCFFFAMAPTANAVLVPVALVGYTLWIEDEGTRRERLRAVAAPLALAVVLAVGLASWNLVHFHAEGWGPRHAFPDEPFEPVRAFAAFGQVMLRQASLFFVNRLGLYTAAGLATCAVAALGLLLAPPRIRLGLLWIGLWVAPSTMMRMEVSAHYGYAPAFGALLVGAELWRRAAASPPLRGLAAAALSGWLVLNAGLLAKDVRYTAYMGELSRDMRGLVLRHAPEVRAHGVVLAVERPAPIRPNEPASYDLGLRLEVRDVDGCDADPSLPCIVWPDAWHPQRHCPDPVGRGCATWHSPAGTAPKARGPHAAVASGPTG